MPTKKIKSSFWEMVTELALPGKIPAGDLAPRIETVLPLAQYHEAVTEDILEVVQNIVESEKHSWVYLLKFDRRSDLQHAVIPGIISELKSYALDGKDVRLKTAVAHLYLFYVREALRQGRLPVMASVYSHDNSGMLLDNSTQ